MLLTPPAGGPEIARRHQQCTPTSIQLHVTFRMARATRDWNQSTKNVFLHCSVVQKAEQMYFDQSPLKVRAARNALLAEEVYCQKRYSLLSL